MPIGVFDSGIGGLTVAKAIKEQLPNEQLIYFGDTKHVPYGDKSVETVRNYALNITNFLLEKKNCKAIVIACNTASAAAYEVLRDTFKGKTPIINVIDPMVEEVITDNAINKIGIIATKTTINSGVYQEKFNRRKASLIVKSLATPLLASVIEEGFFNSNISKEIIHQYLSDNTLNDIDGIVLACTHYPLIKKEINEYYKGSVKIFDSAQVVARKLHFILEKENKLSKHKAGNDLFYVSEYTKSFEHTATQFFGDEITLIKNTI